MGIELVGWAGGFADAHRFNVAELFTFQGKGNMERKPFSKRKSPRDVHVHSFPQELADFYSTHEGCGLVCSPDNPVRFCKLKEVKRFNWNDVHVFGSDTAPGWDSFDAYRIAMGSFFEEYFLVVSAPVCPVGSILMIGVDVPGPGGTGPHATEPTLVVAKNLNEWLTRLQGDAWFELMTEPGDICYYRELNPGIEWENS